VNGPKPRIAVTAFDGNGAGVGQGMADMLTSALVNSNRFIGLERANLREVTSEQDLADTGRFRKDTVAQRGEMEGAELLIRGSVIQFEPECRGGSVIVFSAKEACIAINVRIVDVKTGRVVNATTVEGTSSKKGVGLLYTQANLPIGLGAFSQTPMELALRNAIEAAVNHIATTKF
jgi:curli biogenesis system outer membrane secretion channel CsgG